MAFPLLSPFRAGMTDLQNTDDDYVSKERSQLNSSPMTLFDSPTKYQGRYAERYRSLIRESPPANLMVRTPTEEIRHYSHHAKESSDDVYSPRHHRSPAFPTLGDAEESPVRGESSYARTRPWPSHERDDMKNRDDQIMSLSVSPSNQREFSVLSSTRRSNKSVSQTVTARSADTRNTKVNSPVKEDRPTAVRSSYTVSTREFHASPTINDRPSSPVEPRSSSSYIPSASPQEPRSLAYTRKLVASPHEAHASSYTKTTAASPHEARSSSYKRTTETSPLEALSPSYTRTTEASSLEARSSSYKRTTAASLYEPRSRTVETTHHEPRSTAASRIPAKPPHETHSSLTNYGRTSLPQESHASMVPREINDASEEKRYSLPKQTESHDLEEEQVSPSHFYRSRPISKGVRPATYRSPVREEPSPSRLAKETNPAKEEPSPSHSVKEKNSPVTGRMSFSNPAKEERSPLRSAIEKNPPVTGRTSSELHSDYHVAKEIRSSRELHTERHSPVVNRSSPQEQRDIGLSKDHHHSSSYHEPPASVPHPTHTRHSRAPERRKAKEIPHYMMSTLSYQSRLQSQSQSEHQRLRTVRTGGITKRVGTSKVPRYRATTRINAIDDIRNEMTPEDTYVPLAARIKLFEQGLGNGLVSAPPKMTNEPSHSSSSSHPRPLTRPRSPKFSVRQRSHATSHRTLDEEIQSATTSQRPNAGQTSGKRPTSTRSHHAVDRNATRERIASQNTHTSSSASSSSQNRVIKQPVKRTKYATHTPIQVQPFHFATDERAKQHESFRARLHEWKKKEKEASPATRSGVRTPHSLTKRGNESMTSDNVPTKRRKVDQSQRPVR